jgi:bifunctional non-homologous end joining protein LigD
MPRSPFILPCQPILRKEPPKGPMWTHEVKFDGFRIQIHKDHTDVALYSRNGHDFTSRYPGLARAFSKRCSTRAFILDAELTAIDSDGHPDFGALLIPRLDSDVCVWVFDILSLRGQDLRPLPFITRRYKLDRVMGSCGSPLIQYSEFFSDPYGLLAACSKFKLEGVVSKRIDRPYQSGTSKDWIKVKCATWREANRWRSEFFNKEKRR